MKEGRVEGKTGLERESHREIGGRDREEKQDKKRQRGTYYKEDRQRHGEALVRERRETKTKRAGRKVGGRDKKKTREGEARGG